MTTKYSEKQIEDVAYIFATRGMPDVVRSQLTGDFADLFAADNPPTCAIPYVYHSHHICRLEGGFNREQFLVACGLESEG